MSPLSEHLILSKIHLNDQEEVCFAINEDGPPYDLIITVMVQGEDGQMTAREPSISFPIFELPQLWFAASMIRKLTSQEEPPRPEELWP